MWLSSQHSTWIHSTPFWSYDGFSTCICKTSAHVLPISRPPNLFRVPGVSASPSNEWASLYVLKMNLSQMSPPLLTWILFSQTVRTTHGHNVSCALVHLGLMGLGSSLHLFIPKGQLMLMTSSSVAGLTVMGRSLLTPDVNSSWPCERSRTHSLNRNAGPGACLEAHRPNAQKTWHTLSHSDGKVCRLSAAYLDPHHQSGRSQSISPPPPLPPG